MKKITIDKIQTKALSILLHDKDDYIRVTAKMAITKAEQELVPELTINEKCILKEFLKSGFKYIVRDGDGDISIHIEKPFKEGSDTCWNIHPLDNDFIYLRCFNHLFSFIKWEDDEPWEIEELLDLND